MAGTMPHAIFVETGLDGGAVVAAYAAELPGCAAFAPTDAEATHAIPRRVERFLAWLRAHGEPAPIFVGDNWYEVEREPAGAAGRATFSLDELPPSDEEWERWSGWLELAREELAQAIDAAPDNAAAGPMLAAIAAQDEALTREVGGAPAEPAADPIDRLYEARDRLTETLLGCGPSASGVRRALRLAIADDLRAADALRESGH